MSGEDGRRIDRKILEDIRIAAVTRVLSGESPETVIQDIGFSRTVIYEWLKRYEAGGHSNLKRRKATGRPSRLGSNDLSVLYSKISWDRDVLWTRNIVGEYIKREFGITLSGPAIAQQLEKIGINSNHTTKNINSTNETIIKRWVMEVYPLIRNEAKKQKAEIWFLGVSKRPAEFHTGHRMLSDETLKEMSHLLTVTTISAFKPNNVCFFMADNSSYNVHKNFGENNFLPIADFVEKLILRTKRKVFVIVQQKLLINHPEIRGIAEYNKNKLSIKFLPRKFPQPREDEHIWNYIRDYVR